MYLFPAYTVEHCWRTPTRCFKSRITDLTTQQSYYASLVHSFSHPLKWLSETFSLLKYPLPFLSLLHFHVMILSHTPLRNQKLNRNSLTFLPPSLITYIHIPVPIPFAVPHGITVAEVSLTKARLTGTLIWRASQVSISSPHHPYLDLQPALSLDYATKLSNRYSPNATTALHLHPVTLVRLSPELRNADWPTSILIPL